MAEKKINYAKILRGGDNMPTDKKKWEAAKDAAKKKFDVYPSAVANAWASRKYAEMGGSWKGADGGEVPLQVEAPELRAPPIDPEAYFVAPTPEGTLPIKKRKIETPEVMTPPPEEPDGVGKTLLKEGLVAGAGAVGTAFGGPVGGAAAAAVAKLLTSLFAEGGVVQENMASGGYVVTRSNERKGKTHKVTAPDGSVKFFGDPNLKNRPNNPEAKASWYARHAKSLKDNPHFRAYARATWAEGGIVEDYVEEENMANGGSVGEFAALTDAVGKIMPTPFPEVSDYNDQVNKDSVSMQKPQAFQEGGMAMSAPMENATPVEEPAPAVVEEPKAETPKKEEESFLDSSQKRIREVVDRLLIGLQIKDSGEEIYKDLAGKTFGKEGTTFTDEKEKQPNQVQFKPKEEGFDKGVSASKAMADAYRKTKVAELEKQYPGQGELAFQSFITQRERAISELGGLPKDPKEAERVKREADTAASVATGVVLAQKMAQDARAKSETFLSDEAAAEKAVTEAKAKKLPAPAVTPTLTPIGEIEAATLEAAQALGAQTPQVPPPAAGFVSLELPKNEAEETARLAEYTKAFKGDAAKAQKFLQEDKDLVASLEIPELRYSKAVFDALAARTGRVGMVYNLAKRTNIPDAVARKIAIDQAVLELQQPKLPPLPSGDQAIAEARQLPEIRAIEAADRAAALARLRDIQLKTKQDELTYGLRQLENDLTIRQGIESERRLAEVAEGTKAAVASFQRDAATLDRMVVDARTKSAVGFIPAMLGIIGKGFGATESVVDFARTSVNNDIAKQVDLLGKRGGLVDDYIKMGNSVQASIQLSQATLKSVFAAAITQAAGRIPDERARAQALAAANKLTAEAGQQAVDAVKKEVDMKYEPYKLKVQGVGGSIRDAFEYIKEASDLTQKGMDIEIQRSKLADAREQRRHERAMKEMDAESAALYGRFLQGESLNPGEWAKLNMEAAKRNIKISDLTVKGVKKVTGADGVVRYVPDNNALVAAVSEDNKKRIDTFDQNFDKLQGELDTMEKLAKDNNYTNPLTWDKEAKGRWVQASGYVSRIIANPSELGLGTPQAAETEFLQTLIPTIDAFTSEGFTKGQFAGFRDRLANNVVKIRERNTIGGATPASANTGRTSVVAPTPANQYNIGVEEISTGKIRYGTRSQVDALLSDPANAGKFREVK